MVNNGIKRLIISLFCLWPAHTTASDAFGWFNGYDVYGRVAASLLFAIGLPELVTQTQRGYEALAIELATSSAKLKAIKDKLSTNRHSTPLFDTTKFNKHIEDAYVKMYEFYQTNSVPVHIYITY